MAATDAPAADAMAELLPDETVVADAEAQLAVTDICLTMCNMVTLCVTVFSVARGGGGNLNNGPARSVQSASHDGTDPPKLTFEARLSTLTLKVVPSGRLSRPRFREAVSAPKWPNSRVARSAADPSGLGAGDGRDTERLRTGCELLCRGAPRCRYRRHWPGSNSRRGMSLR